MVKGQSYFQAMSSSIEDRSSPNRIEIAPTTSMPRRGKESLTSPTPEEASAVKLIDPAANAPRHTRTDSSSSFHSCQEDFIPTIESKSPTLASLSFSPPKGPRMLDNVSTLPTHLSAIASPPKGPRIPAGTPTGPKAWRSRSIDYSPSLSVRKLSIPTIKTSTKPPTHQPKPPKITAKGAIESRSSRTTLLRDNADQDEEGLDKKRKRPHPADALLRLLDAPALFSSTDTTRKRKGIDEGRLSPGVSPSRERKRKVRKRDEGHFGKKYTKPEISCNDHYSPLPSREASPDRKEQKFGAQKRKKRGGKESKERIKREEMQEKMCLKTFPIMKGGEEESRLPSSIFRSHHDVSQAPPKLSMLLTPIVAPPQSSSFFTTSNEVCYNCGRQGHWFMDCVTGCGRCRGDGHRTIDCPIVYETTDRAKDIGMDGY